MCKGVHASEKKKKVKEKDQRKIKEARRKRERILEIKPSASPSMGVGVGILLFPEAALQNMSSPFVYASVTWQDLPLVPAL